MNTKIFNFILVSLIVAALSGLASCSNDENYYVEPAFYSTIGSLDKNENSEYYINSDKNKKLLVENSQLLTNAEIKEGDRVYSEFTLNESKPEGYDEAINMLYVYKVLVKDPVKLTDENSAEIADNNIGISSIWSSKNYLNFFFQFLGSGQTKHFINLVTVDNPKKTEDGYLYVEFRHNAYGEASKNAYNGIVSFDITDLLAENPNLKGFIVRVNTYFEGEQFYKIDINADNMPKTSLKSAAGGNNVE